MATLSCCLWDCVEGELHNEHMMEEMLTSLCLGTRQIPVYSLGHTYSDLSLGHIP